MASVADQVHFNTFSVVLDKIANKTGTENKKKVLKEFIATWRGCHAELHNDSHIDTVCLQQWAQSNNSRIPFILLTYLGAMYCKSSINAIHIYISVYSISVSVSDSVDCMEMIA